MFTEVPEWILTHLKKQRNHFVEHDLKKHCDARMRETVKFLYDNMPDDVITVESCQGHGKAYNKKYNGRDAWSNPYLLFCCTEDGYNFMSDVHNQLVAKLVWKSVIRTNSTLRSVPCHYPGPRVGTTPNGYNAYVLSADTVICAHMNIWTEYLRNSVFDVKKMRDTPPANQLENYDPNLFRGKDENST